MIALAIISLRNSSAAKSLILRQYTDARSLRDVSGKDFLIPFLPYFTGFFSRSLKESGAHVNIAHAIC
jgi:hypothetical protein